jgi:SHAQKYF class myb-like DNA-binding protein
MPRSTRRQPSRSGIWTEDEHDRFLTAIREFPKGPWLSIAQAVGTRSVRQVQTHTQKYYEKIMRRVRGLRKDRKTWARVEHRIDDDILEFCKLMKRSPNATDELLPQPSTPRPRQPRAKKADANSISPHNSPLRRCAAFAHDGAKHKLDSTTKVIPELSLSIDDVGELELPPLDAALDFLIEIMET